MALVSSGGVMFLFLFCSVEHFTSADISPLHFACVESAVEQAEVALRWTHPRVHRPVELV